MQMERDREAAESRRNQETLAEFAEAKDRIAKLEAQMFGSANDAVDRIRSEFMQQQAAQFQQHQTEIHEERTKVSQAEKSFSELEAMLAASKQEYDALSTKRQQDQQRLHEELAQARAQTQADHAQAEEWTKRISAEMAEGSANFNLLEGKYASSAQSAPLLHYHYEAVTQQIQDRCQEVFDITSKDGNNLK